MPRRAKELKALEVKRLSKPGRHAVGGAPPGLSLSISQSGGKSWIFRVTIGDERRHIGLGSYPTVSLAQARELAIEEARKIKSGIDPVAARIEERNARASKKRQRITFAKAFDRFHETKIEGEKQNAKHIKQWRSTLVTYAFPVIGDKPISAITMEDVLEVLQPIWQTKNETASRVRQRIETVLDWAKVMKMREGENPARWKGNLEQILPSSAKIKTVDGHPAIALDEIAAWFHLLRSRDGIAALALQFLTLTATRSGEVRGALWEEIDWKHSIWTIPAERMKAKAEHRVPLSSVAVDLLKAAPKMKDCPYVFPSPRNGQMSDMTISAVMRRIQEAEVRKGKIGFLDPRSRRPAVPHGLRSSFRDWAAERTSFPREIAEMALAHTVGSDVERAYRRTDMIEKRREIMEDWARFLSKTTNEVGET
ncbi:site-specific integrase [Roseovarius spongiae]|uniref:Site-specific integrase n=1 Tax=Roseovarius spongiae TaxID=2320272 RepID=A0A3A8AWW5_9RHOB|nr:site-specific integrase [Roseovarius spongiae]